MMGPRALIPVVVLAAVLSACTRQPPSRQCDASHQCVLVRATFCGAIEAVRLGQDQAWADWDLKDREQASREKRDCSAQAQLDPRTVEAACQRGQCVVVPKPPPRADSLPPPPASAPAGKPEKAKRR